MQIIDGIEVLEKDFEIEVTYIGNRERGVEKIENGVKVRVFHFEKSSMIHIASTEEGRSPHFCVRLHSIWGYVKKESAVVSIGSIQLIDGLIIALPKEPSEKMNPEFSRIGYDVGYYKINGDPKVLYYDGFKFLEPMKRPNGKLVAVHVPLPSQPIVKSIIELDQKTLF